MTKFYFHPRCSTCKKARAWLNEHNIVFEEQDLTLQAPTLETLQTWYNESALPIGKLFNTSGQQYRALGMKDKIKTETPASLLQTLSTDGMLVKRPVLVVGDKVVFGFKPEVWESLFT